MQGFVQDGRAVCSAITSPQRSSFHLITLGVTQEEIGRSSFPVPVFNQEALSHARHVTAD